MTQRDLLQGSHQVTCVGIWRELPVTDKSNVWVSVKILATQNTLEHLGILTVKYCMHVKHLLLFKSRTIQFYNTVL